MELIHIGAGLAILIAVNILLGSINALLNGEFNLTKFWKGIVKGLVVTVCVCTTWYAGNLNPDIVAIQIGDEMFNVADAMKLLLTSSFVYYSVEVLGKIAKIIKSKIVVKDEPEVAEEIIEYEEGVG